MAIVLTPFRGVRAYIHSGFTTNERSMAMGRILAFPDLKSHSEYPSVRTNHGAHPADRGTSDNVVIFDGIFVEYHERTGETARTAGALIGETDIAAFQLERPQWPSKDKPVKVGTSEPEDTPRLRRR